ncbi:hypothetical protein MHBO_001121 [Bonamia ostreae]|uniref:Ribosomal protein S14 n=1 Tax=Bonamia ostreae TaxID=126728 RepID=A0ABV2AHV9_9EUKA
MSKLANLRQTLRNLKIDAFIIPTKDAHNVQIVISVERIHCEQRQAPRVHFRVQRVRGDCCRDHGARFAVGRPPLLVGRRTPNRQKILGNRQNGPEKRAFAY